MVDRIWCRLQQTLSIPVVLTSPETPENLILAPSKEALATIQDIWRNSVIIEGYCGKTGQIDATEAKYIQANDDAALTAKLKEINQQLGELFHAYGLKVPPQAGVSGLADKAQDDPALQSSPSASTHPATQTSVTQ